MERKRPFLVELILPAALAVFGVVYYLTTTDLSRQAVFFPHMMMVVMAALTAIVLLKEFFDRRRPDYAVREPAAGWRETLTGARKPLSVFALALAYYGLIILAGYFAATVAFLLASLLVFGVRPLRAVLLAVLFPGALYLVFVLLFQIRVG